MTQPSCQVTFEFENAKDSNISEKFEQNPAQNNKATATALHVANGSVHGVGLKNMYSNVHVTKVHV